MDNEPRPGTPAERLSPRKRVAKRVAKRREKRAKKSDRSTPTVSIRSQILDGAATQFSTRGFADTSVEHVLAAAGVSRRTFYRFFRNKDEVLSELFETASLLLVQAIKSAVMVGKTAEERLDNAIEVFIRAPQSVGPLALIFHVEAARPGSHLAPRREAIIEQIIGLLDHEVTSAQGELSPPADPLLYRGLVAALEHVSLYTYTKTEASAEDLDRAKAVMTHIVQRVLDDLAGAPRASVEEARA